MTDRELDAAVAVRVMGWVHEPSEDPDLCEWKKPDGHYDILPRYSTTGDGLLAVVGAMRDKGFDCKILLKDYAHVLFDAGDNDEEWTLAEGPHWAHEDVKSPKGLPHTVCLAALKALGENP